MSTKTSDNCPHCGTSEKNISETHWLCGTHIATAARRNDACWEGQVQRLTDEIRPLREMVEAITIACNHWGWEHATTAREFIETVSDLIEFKKLITEGKYLLNTHNGEDFALIEWKEFEAEEGLCLCAEQPAGVAITDMGEQIARQKKDIEQAGEAVGSFLDERLTLKREITRLRGVLKSADDMAGGRWSEWGGRAEMVQNIIQGELASPPAAPAKLIQRIRENEKLRTLAEDALALCYQIERLPASTEATLASVMASDLRQNIVKAGKGGAE